MSENHSTERINQTDVSCWNSDNLGDLLAEGIVHIDEVSDRAVGQLTQQEEHIRHEQSEREFDEWLQANEPLPAVSESDEEKF